MIIWVNKQKENKTMLSNPKNVISKKKNHDVLKVTDIKGKILELFCFETVYFFCFLYYKIKTK